jgi:hypothetical protein
MRHKLLGQPTPRQSQVRLSAATADIDNDQTDDHQIGPIITITKKQTNVDRKLFIHYTHEKRFQSFKQDMHRVYKDIFANT